MMCSKVNFSTALQSCTSIKQTEHCQCKDREFLVYAFYPAILQQYGHKTGSHSSHGSLQKSRSTQIGLLV